MISYFWNLLEHKNNNNVKCGPRCNLCWQIIAARVKINKSMCGSAHTNVFPVCLCVCPAFSCRPSVSPLGCQWATQCCWCDLVGELAESSDTPERVSLQLRGDIRSVQQLWPGWNVVCKSLRYGVNAQGESRRAGWGCQGLKRTAGRESSLL